MKMNIQCAAAVLIISNTFCMNLLYCMNNHVSSKYNVEMEAHSSVRLPKIAFKSGTSASSSSVASSLSQEIISHSQNPSQQDNGQTEKPRSPSIICGNQNQGETIQIYEKIISALLNNYKKEGTLETNNHFALDLMRSYSVLENVPEKRRSNVIEYMQNQIDAYHRHKNNVVVDITAIQDQQALQLQQANHQNHCHCSGCCCTKWVCLSIFAASLVALLGGMVYAIASGHGFTA